MKKEFLHNNWKLMLGDGTEIPATVPGCVHTDLIQNQLLDDPFWRDNNKQNEWIEQADWTYYCTFDAKPDRPANLVFEGLDTYADIYLNGVCIGEVHNMHIPHRFLVDGKLKEENNRLEVRFRSPIREVEGLPLYEAAFTAERLHTRRIQCTYGWDWVERFVTCGIYRPVYLEYGNDMHVDNLYIYTKSIDSFGAQMYVELNFANVKEGGIADIEVFSPQGEKIREIPMYVHEETLVCHIDIADAQLWYPNGYGKQPLYTLRVTVGDNILTQTFGIRTIRIMQLVDPVGSENHRIASAAKDTKIGKMFSHNETFSGFEIIVNGKKIFCKGANWVPCEPFPSAETIEKFEKLIDMAQDMHINMLRVWGGGIFEHSAFYDACDRAGILVVQDFLMACGHYPEKEEWFIQELLKESKHAVLMLRNHACLAWWHGDNENATSGNDTMEDYNGRDSALKGIEPNIRRYDPNRVFLRSSPYGGDTYASVTAGTAHNSNYVWDMFEYFGKADGTDYRNFLEGFLARFVAEEPTFGAVSKTSMLKCMTEEDLYSDEEDIVRYHTKNNPCIEPEIFDYMALFAKKVLGEFQNPQDRFFKYKYIQYEWVRIMFENCRRHSDYCSGEIFWMFNDCWPAALGWSLVDYYGMPKAATYAFKRCAQQLMVSLSTCADGYVAHICNDGAALSVSGKAYLMEVSDLSHVCEEYSFETFVEEYHVNQIALPWKQDNRYFVVCDVTSGERKDRTFYKDGRLEVQKKEIKASILKDEIVVNADEYIHIVEFEGEGYFSDNYFSLMPGEIRKIRYQTADGVQGMQPDITAYSLDIGRGQ